MAVPNIQHSVLVLGDNALAGLQIVRSLGRAGVDVHLATFETGSPTRRSRYVRQIHDLGHPFHDTDRFVQCLFDLITRNAFDLVIPSSDTSLVPLMSYREEIVARVPFAAPEPAAFVATQQKDKTIELASRVGIRIPRTVVIRDSDWSPIQQLRGLPLILKPSKSVIAGGPDFLGVRVVSSHDQLSQYLPDLLEYGPVLIQEYWPGTGLGLGILADRGQIFAAFQYRRVHEPPAGGPSTYRVSEPLSENLLDDARRFCREIDWTGPAMFEYRVHAETGEPALMEVNGRMWGSIALPIQAGVDFPRLLYELLVLRKTTETFDYRIPYFVRNIGRDIYWFQANLRAPGGQRDVIKVPTRKVLREFGNLLFMREGFDLESLSDPFPGIMGWWNLLGEMASDVMSMVIAAWWRRIGHKNCRQVRKKPTDLIVRLGRVRSILFVCTGNINRSAVAAARMIDLLRQTNVTIRVASAGLIHKANRGPSNISRVVAAELGVDISAHQSVAVTPQMLDEFELIVVMESLHLKAISRRNKNALQRSYLLSSFDPADKVVDVPDPYGKDRREFQDVYRRVVRCVDELYRCVQKNNNDPL